MSFWTGLYLYFVAVCPQIWYKGLGFLTIIALFLSALITIGYLFSRKNRNIEDYFVAGRSMPGWLVAVAATGTTISAGTFVGSPELGFNTNLTYVLNLLGAIVGGTLVAAFILPRLYNAGTITIYGFLGDRFGQKARRANSVMFLVGQSFNPFLYFRF